MSLHDDPFLIISNSITNPYIEAWKNNNKKVLGYYCTYLPEELFHAARLLPFRIRATNHKEDNLADTYMVRFTCSFVRTTLDLALRGGYDFLDGLFISNCCDHARRMYEIYDLKVFSRKEFKQKPPRFYTAVPHVITAEGFEWYKKEVEELKEELEESYNIKITNAALKDSIIVYNENRQLLRELYQLRCLDAPKLSGSEFLQISMANSSVPKEIANQELKRILEKVKNREGLNLKAKKRIMLVGSVVDNINYTNLIEESGSCIVTDLLCFGNRNILDDVDLKSDGDHLDNISKRAYYRMSCPRMMDDHLRRLDYLKEQVKIAKVDGIILERINNCDLHGCDNMLFEYEFKDSGIPVFNMDRESYQADTSRLQTRIEAFLEMIHKR